MKKMDPMDAMKEANKVLKKKVNIKIYKKKMLKELWRIQMILFLEEIFQKIQIGFAIGGRVGMAGGGILKLAMKFFNDNNPGDLHTKNI
jgi:hypothetical protein